MAPIRQNKCFQPKIRLNYNCFKCEMQKNTYFHEKHYGQSIIVCGACGIEFFLGGGRHILYQAANIFGEQYHDGVCF